MAAVFPGGVKTWTDKTDLVDFMTASILNDDIMDEIIAVEQNLRKQNFTATAAPTVNDDAGDDYKIGSLWYDATNQKMYVCLDNTTGAAVWKLVTFLGTGGATATRVLFADTDGMPTGDSDLTWDGTALTVGGSNPVSGAALDVSGGDLVVSDGAGGEKATILDSGQFILTPHQYLQSELFRFATYEVNSGGSVSDNAFRFTWNGTSSTSGGYGTYLLIINGRNNSTYFNVITFLSIAKRYNGNFQITSYDLGTPTTKTEITNTATALDFNIKVGGGEIRDGSWIIHQLNKGIYGNTLNIEKTTI